MSATVKLKLKPLMVPNFAIVQIKPQANTAGADSGPASTCDWCGGCFDPVREGDAYLCSMCAAPPPALAPRFDTSQIEERLSEIDKRFLEPLIKKAAHNFYCQVLDTVDDYLLENLSHNMTSHIRMLERENAEMRTHLWDVDRALGCLSMGHETRLSTIKETNQRFNQATSECWRLRAELASVTLTEGGDAKQAPGASLSGAAREAGDAQ